MGRIRACTSFCLWISLGVAIALAGRGPFMRLSEREIEFGTVDQYQQFHHDLVITNQGDQPLRILKVETSCGCTVGSVKDSLVFPGRETHLDVAFSTKDMKGEQEKQVVLYTNDPAEPRVVIRIRADVRELIRLSADAVRFEPLPAGQTAVKSVRVAADKIPGLEITGIEGAEGIVETSIHPVEDRTESIVEITFRIRPEAPAGLFREVVTFQTKRPKLGKTNILVAGQIVSYFEVKGDSRVRLSSGAKGKLPQGVVEISCDGSKPYRLTGVETGLAYLVGEIVSIDATHYEVRLSMTDAAPEGHVQQPVKITTTDPKEPVIELDVRSSFRR